MIFIDALSYESNLLSIPPYAFAEFHSFFRHPFLRVGPGHHAPSGKPRGSGCTPPTLVAKGDENAMKQCIEAYGPLVWSIVCRRISHRTRKPKKLVRISLRKFGDLPIGSIPKCPKNRLLSA